MNNPKQTRTRLGLGDFCQSRFPEKSSIKEHVIRLERIAMIRLVEKVQSLEVRRNELIQSRNTTSRNNSAEPGLATPESYAKLKATMEIDPRPASQVRIQLSTRDEGLQLPETGPILVQTGTLPSSPDHLKPMILTQLKHSSDTPSLPL